MSKDIISKTKLYIEKELSGEGSGHDWWHIYRVWKLAKLISKYEGGNRIVIELAALLHDIADWKFHNGDETVGPQKARIWLDKNQVSPDIIDEVCQIIATLSFKGAGVKNKIESLEGKIVQDADRLDALGAIGVARAFAYGGFKQRELHNPLIQSRLHQTPDEYKTNQTTTINHFYEKLLLLKDRMNTKTGKKLAVKRHSYIQRFLQEFYKEWELKDQF